MPRGVRKVKPEQDVEVEPSPAEEGESSEVKQERRRGGVEVGDVVVYVDKFSRQEHQARVSLLHGGDKVNLQVFTGKSATRPLAKVPKGTGGGCWKPLPQE